MGFTISGTSHDVLNLHDLLTGGDGVTSGTVTAAALDSYLNFGEAGGNVVISVVPTGSGDATQTITLENVTLADLHGLSGSGDQDIITKMLAAGTLKTDV